MTEDASVLQAKTLASLRATHSSPALKGMGIPASVIDRYHDLWHVEKAFRMAKTDLLARPIYHYKKRSIEAHLLIVFMSLCLSRALEITTHLSLARAISLLWEVEDITLIDPQTHDSYTKRSSKISQELTNLLAKLKTAY